MDRPSIYEFVGGAPAFRALAQAHHRRCLLDPLLNHAFAHPGNPEHVQRLADYWGEVFGGPKVFSQSYGGHSAMLQIHAGQGGSSEFGIRFGACFLAAAEEVGLPLDQLFRELLRQYMESAVLEVDSYSPEGSAVPDGLPVPQWGWGGREEPPAPGSAG